MSSSLSRTPTTHYPYKFGPISLHEMIPPPLRAALGGLKRGNGREATIACPSDEPEGPKGDILVAPLSPSLRRCQSSREDSMAREATS